MTRYWNDNPIAATTAQLCAVMGDVVSFHERHGSRGSPIR